MNDELSKIAVFEQKEIRKVLHSGEWWFAVVDVVAVLTESIDAGAYWRKLKERLHAEGTNEVVTNCHTLKMKAKDGKNRAIDAMNTEGVFRLIQSIPSKNAEPMKLWLAKTGYERVQEIENPELAMKRMKETYRAKGYDDAWIERRSRGIAIRNELTDEWSKRGVNRPTDYAILTSEISKAAFSVTPSEYKKIKGIKRENLRDHMTDLDLLFSQLGEASTTEIAKAYDARGMDQNKDAAQRGGSVAGTARKQLESETQKKVITGDNFLNTPKQLK